MKKLFIIAVFAVICGTALFAQTYRDGFYFAQDADFAANNQKNQVVLEVKGGKIASANWNVESLNAGAQDLKTLSRASNAAAAIKTWATQTKAAEDFLVSSQNVNAASVQGGPANVAPFFNLVKKALAAAPVAKGAYKDGWYFAVESAVDPYHTRNYVLLTIVNGTIVDALWNGALQGMPASINPSKIITSKAGKYPMTGARSAWHTQAVLVTAELVKVQNPDSIRTNAAGKPDAISGASIEIGHFQTVVKQALQAAK